jgi:WD40 repeat protein
MAATREAEAAEAARREAEFRTYVATIAAADGDLRSNRPREARQRLLAVPPGQRGWEWDHLLLQSDPSLATLESGAPCESWLSGGARLLRTFAHGPRIPPNMNRAIWSGAHALTVLNGGAEIALRHCTRIDAWIGGAGTPLTYEAAELILAAGPAGDVLTLVPRAVERVRLELIRGEISELMIRSGPWELHRFATGSRVAIGTLGPFEQQPACAAISPDGRLIAVGFVPRFNEKGWPEDDIFEVWDARASRRLARMVPTKPPEDTRTAPACHVLFSPDSTRLASSGATVHVWDASSWAVVVADPAQAGKVSQPIAFSPDGMRMAIGRLTGLVDVLHLDGSQRLDHLEANGLIAALPPPVADRIALVAARRRNEVKAIGFSPDGTRVVTGADVNVGVWDLARGVLTAFRSGHSLDVVGVAVAPDGRIVSADTTGTVKVWPADATGAVTVRRGRFSIDQDRLEVSRDGSIAVVPQTDGGLLGWRLADMSEIVFRPGTGKRDPSAVTSLALTRDGRHVLIGENDQVGTVQTLEVPSGRSVRSAPAHARLEADCTPGRAPARNGVFEMAVSPDGRALGTIDGDCLVVRDPETMRVLAVLRELPVRFAFRPDGRLVVATRSYQSRRARFLIWEWQTDRIRAAVPAPAPLIWRIAMSADGQRVAFSGRDLLHPAIVSVWDGDLTREHGRLPVPANTSFAALSADGSRIATSTLDDSAIDIWDVDRLQLLHVLSDDEAQSGGLGLAFTPDGRLIAARRSGGVTIWQTRRAR